MGKIRAKQKSLILKPKSAWVPPGQAVTVAGYRIPDGMVYVGQNLKAVGDPGIEPALINPLLPVDPKMGSSLMPSFPRYSTMSPQERAAYLRWLANGRSKSDAVPGFLFLFLYGVERRLLSDGHISRLPAAEWLQLIGEIERLLDLHRENYWFQLHAGPFVTLARLLSGTWRIEAFEPRLDLLGSDALWRVGPSLFAAANRPLSPIWAHALWSDWQGARRGTAEHRCPSEFRELFLIRYREAFRAGGLRVKPSQQQLLIEYRPANPGFAETLVVEPRGLTEVRISRLQQLQKIANQVSAELDPFSRRVGRTRDTTSLAALALLPPELLQGREKDVLSPLREWLATALAETGFAQVRWEDVLKHWPADTPGRLTLRAFEAFASFIGALGYGVEPEPRFGGLVPKEGPFLFRLPPGVSARTWEPGPGYEAAAVVLQLAVAVATADGPLDKRQEEHLLRHIEEAAHLGPAERERLQIRLLWLLAEPQRLLGLEKRSRILSEAQRHAVIRFLLGVAGADGQVSPGEIQQLKRIYRLLQLDPQTLFSDVHALASGAPVVAGRAGETSLELDARKIEAKLAETEQVAFLLEEVFTEDEPPAPSRDLAGLDAAHTALLRELATRAAWERADLDHRAAALGLLPDGALEALNEAAFDRCGAPLLEGEETIEIDAEVLREMLG